MKLFTVLADGSILGTQQGEIILCKANCADKFALEDINSSSGSNIIATAVSKDNQLLCCVFDNKSIVVWSIESGKCVSQGLLKKAPSGVTFVRHNNNLAVLVSDKAGEIYAINPMDLTKQLKIGGHTASIITDIEISPDNRYLITCDRDEKIRVTNFPYTSNIQSYCIGHRSVVVSVSVITVKGAMVIVSICWDNEVRLWSLLTGELIDTMKTPFAEADEEEDSTPSGDAERASEVCVTPVAKAARVESPLPPGPPSLPPLSIFSPSGLHTRHTVVVPQVVTPGFPSKPGLESQDSVEVEDAADDEFKEKVYDVKALTGSPEQICTVKHIFNGAEYAFAAVIYKKHSIVHIISLDNGEAIGFGRSVTVDLPDMPKGIAFTVNEAGKLLLYVFLPSPNYCIVYEILEANGISACPHTETDQTAPVSVFNRYCLDNGVSLGNVMREPLARGDGGISGFHDVKSEYGLAKHVLDKPFSRVKRDYGQMKDL